MKLEQLKPLKLKIIRPGEFETLGILNHQSKKMLVYVEDEKYLAKLNLRYTAAVICPAKLKAKIAPKIGVVSSEKPKETFLRIHQFMGEGGFYPKIKNKKISSSAKIHPSAVIGSEGIYIGQNSTIGANVVIFPNTHIGDKVIIADNSIIGAEGFEYVKNKEKLSAVTHYGGVWIEDEVEIKSNSTIDKALFGGYTFIGRGSKLDKNVQISHTVKIGKNCLIVAGAIINGSTFIGDNVYVGPGAVISDSLKIGNRAFISLGAVVVKDVPAGQKVTGNFAVDHHKFLYFLIKNKLY